jgi:hypothetical protein
MDFENIGSVAAVITAAGTNIDELPSALLQIGQSIHMVFTGTGFLSTRGGAASSWANDAAASTTTPVFAANNKSGITFLQTLTSNVTSSSFTGPTAGMYIFAITQDNSGGHTFAWPLNVSNAPGVDGGANDTTYLLCQYDGINCAAISSLITGPNVTPGITIPGLTSGSNTITAPAIAGTGSKTNLAPNGTTVIPNACSGQVVQSIAPDGTITCGSGGGGAGPTAAGYVVTDAPTMSAVTQYQWGTLNETYNAAGISTSAINNYQLATYNPTGSGSFGHALVNVCRFGLTGDGTGDVGNGSCLYGDHTVTGNQAHTTSILTFTHYEGLNLAAGKTVPNLIGHDVTWGSAGSGASVTNTAGVHINAPLPAMVNFSGVTCCYPGYVPIPGQWATSHIGYSDVYTDVVTKPSGVANGTLLYNDSASHLLVENSNNAGAFPLTQTLYTGTQALGIASIASGACDSSPIEITVTGADPAKDTLYVNAQSDPRTLNGYSPSAGGGLYLNYWLTANTVNIARCNNTTSTLTPSALNATVKVIR